MPLWTSTGGHVHCQRSSKRFLAYLSERQGVPEPLVDSASVRDYLAHLAVHRSVSASTQNQAMCAILFLCREVLGVNVDGLSLTAMAKGGTHLPVVLSVPEAVALLGAMRGTTWLMAALIYGGGLRVSECCQLRVKDPDFDQGLVFVRQRGQGPVNAIGRDGTSGTAHTPQSVGDALPGRPRCGTRRRVATRCPGSQYPNAGRELGWFWVFPSQTLSTDPRAGVVRRHRVSDSVVQLDASLAMKRSRRHVTSATKSNGIIHSMP